MWRWWKVTKPPREPERKVEPTPPPAPDKEEEWAICPSCGRTAAIEITGVGLWDGVDTASGRAVGGIFKNGTCSQCKTKLSWYGPHGTWHVASRNGL
jgi:hypothetical protein